MNAIEFCEMKFENIPSMPEQKSWSSRKQNNFIWKVESHGADSW